MKISRYYQAQSFELNETVELSKENHRHAVQVLRSDVGSSLILFNGQGGEYVAKFIEVSKRHSQVKIEAFNVINTESPLKTTLVLAMIKPEKMDFAIQKAVELGVDVIQPVYTRRSVVRIKSNRIEKKMGHWQRVVISASEQSGRTRLAQIQAPVDLNSWLALPQPPHQLRVALLPGDYPGLLELADKDLTDTVTDLALIIGPEGGFREDEEQQMLSKGVTPVSFGPRILRAETAAVSALTASQLIWGDLYRNI